MEPNSYTAQFTTPVLPPRVMDAISNVKGWWTADVRGSSFGKGDRFTTRFGTTYSDFLITEWIPEKKIAWHVEDCNLPLFADPKEWKGTRIVWEISTGANGTTLTMTHDGLTPKKACFNDCRGGWNFYFLGSLQKLVAEGKGTPGTGIFGYIFSGNRKYEGKLFEKTEAIPDYPEGYIYIDVKKTKGEEVVEAWSVNEYDKNQFNRTDLKGNYVMLLKNTPIEAGIAPLDDINNLLHPGSSKPVNRH